MNLNAKIKAFEKKIPPMEDELTILAKELKTWTDGELRQIAYCPIGEAFPSHLQKRLEGIGIEFTN